MRNVPLHLVLAQIHHHRRPVLGALGALMLGTGFVAIGVINPLPDVAQWPDRQVVNPLLATDTLTASSFRSPRNFAAVHAEISSASE